MWAWRSLFCVSVVCGLVLDSNTIRSSKEAPQNSELMDQSNSDQEETSSRSSSSSNRRAASSCSGRDCNAPPRGGCSNQAQKRTSSSDRVMDSQRDSDKLNRTKGVEMASCVRSADCSAGLCCARYLTGKRCQRIPQEGEVCLLRGPTKLRRNLGRCDCAAGLACAATAAGGKAQGVCVARPRQGQRKTRHSGKKRRPVASEQSC